MARTVTSPDGRRWRVARRWTNRRMPRWRSLGKGGDDGSWLALGDLGSGGGDVLGAILLGIAIIVLIGLFVFFVVPLIVFTVELLIVLILIAGAALTRILLGRPWTVEARSGDTSLIYPVKGWRASGEKVDEVASGLERGVRATPSATEATTAR